MNLFLSFPGTAAAAIEFYLKALPGAKLKEITYNTDSVKVLNAQLEFLDQTIMFMDVDGAPAFTWATSLYVEAATEVEFMTLFTGLKEEGSVMMGPEPAGIMKLVAWVTDKFGVTWQLAWRDI